MRAFLFFQNSAYFEFGNDISQFFHRNSQGFSDLLQRSFPRQNQTLFIAGKSIAAKLTIAFHFLLGQSFRFPPQANSLAEMDFHGSSP
jgi:hypothetical protein